MSPPGTPELDCRTCGVCCRGRSGTVLVTAEDLVRWRRAERHDLMMHLVDGHFDCDGLPVDERGACVHLEYDGQRATCTIYDLRPQVCAEFAVGSRECLAARRRGGRD